MAMGDMPLPEMKTRTIHRQVYENGELIEESTREVTDWDQYWVLDFDGKEKEHRSGVLFIFDKEEYPSLEHARNAVLADQLRRKLEKEQAENTRKAEQARLRKERSDARKARTEA